MTWSSRAGMGVCRGQPGSPATGQNDRIRPWRCSTRLEGLVTWTARSLILLLPQSFPWNDCQALCRDRVFYKYFLTTTAYTVCSASGADGSVNEAVGCLLRPSSVRLHRSWGYAGSRGAQASSFLYPQAWMLSTPVSRTPLAQLMSVCQAFCCWCLYLRVLISTK